MSATVIILGAGASSAEGAPTQANLLRDYFKSYRRRPPGAQYLEMDNELRTYFDLIWGISIDHDELDAAPFPTFEEALGLLELAQSRGEFFRDFGGLDQHNTRGQQLRQWLVASIASILGEKLEGTNGVHRELTRNLAKSVQWGRVSYVSLNYDIIIDNAIAEEGQQRFYGVEFRSGAIPQLAQERVGLYKIHGSLEQRP